MGATNGGADEKIVNNTHLLVIIHARLSEKVGLKTWQIELNKKKQQLSNKETNHSRLL